tara:strand:+ start:21 stop:689 length:669 start_codon:yes stop_codon:yes gene_type:complete
MYKQAPKSPILKALVGNQPNLPEGLREAIEATPNKMMDSPAKQVTKNKNLGGQPIAGMDSAADVPTSTSFGGRDYDKGYQDGSGVHYYNKGYSSKHGKKGTIKRAGDDGIYHVSRKVEEPISELKNKEANIISPAKQTKEPSAKSIRRHAERVNRKINRDLRIAENNPERGANRAERLNNKADRQLNRIRKSNNKRGNYGNVVTNKVRASNIENRIKNNNEK